jgi:hypothetical protein
MSDEIAEIAPDVLSPYDDVMAEVVEHLRDKDVVEDDDVVKKLDLHMEAEETVRITNIETRKADWEVP